MDHLPRLRLLPHVCAICYLIPFKFEARETGSVLYMSNCIMGLWIMGTADAIASVLAVTKLRVKLGQNSSLKRSQSHAKQQNLKLHVRLSQCYVKLHHGTVLGMLSLLLLAGLKFALQTVLQCSLAPHCQSLRPDCIIELSWAISSFIVYMMQSCPRKWVKIRPGGGGTRSLMGDARMANERLREQQK